MDYQNVAAKILEINNDPERGFDDTDFMEKLENFLHTTIEKNMLIAHEHINQMSFFVFQEKFREIIKIVISNTEQSSAYYQQKREELQKIIRSLSYDENTTPAIELKIGGETDILLYELLSRFDELRNDIYDTISDCTEKQITQRNAQELINNILTEYEAILLQITDSKEVIFEIQTIINNYITERKKEIHEKTRENTPPRQELPEAKIIKLPSSFWKK